MTDELHDVIADAIGELPEAHNVFDMTGEATTLVNAQVDVIAGALTPRMRQEITEAELEATARERNRIIDRLKAAQQSERMSDVRPNQSYIDALGRAIFIAEGGA